jgi:serine phosphatase RsbU (regulator of sigma subunit)
MAISAFLVQTLVETKSLNDFFEHVLPEIARSFGASRGVLVDYRENTGHFDVLHFVGYEERARFRLQQELQVSELKRALEHRAPYSSTLNPGRLFVPLYFTETLEAIIVLESDQPIELTPERQNMALIVSRFVGLLMSSNRLSINKTGLVDFDDLQRARQIQLSYLPQEGLSTDRYEVYGYNQSSALVGGDYFDYFRLRENSMQCILADASGHGLSAALIMSTFRALLHSEIQRHDDSRPLFDVLNRSVHSGGSIIQYLTGVFLDFDEAQSHLRYMNAGHFEPAIVRTDGTIERLSGGGPPLGMFKHSRYPTQTAKISSGDLLVLFTDGLTDLRNQAEDFFGEQRILSIAASHRNAPLKDLASVLLEQGIAFSASPNPEDDLTLFLVRFS